jgi:hypothetical protein
LAILDFQSSANLVHFFLVTSDPIARYQAQQGLRGTAIEKLTPSEVIDTALRVYQRQGLTFLRLTALPSVFCLAAFAFVWAYLFPAFFTTRDPESIGVQATEVLITLGLAVFVAGPVFLTGLTYGSALVVHMTADLLEGRPISEFEAQKSARLALPALFWQNVRELLLATSGILVSTAFMLVGSYLTTVTNQDSAAAGVVALIGVFGLILGFVIFLVMLSRHALALPAAVIESKRGKEAGKRSKTLLKKSGSQSAGYGSVYSVYFLLALAGLIFIGSVEFALSLLSIPERASAWLAGSWLQPLVTQALDLAPLYLVLWALVPAWATALTVIYYERRVRIEGYDIEALGRQTHEDRASRFNV